MTPEDRITAAELAIGLLEGEERASALARVDGDPAFARDVEWWHRQLVGLLVDIGEVAPPEHLRARIEARLDVPSIGARRSGPAWRLIGIGGALGAMAASLVAWMLTVPDAARVAPRPPVASTPPMLVASLAWTGKPDQQATVALLDRATGTLRLSAGISLPKGRVGQLWRIPPGGTPVPLGVLSTGAVPHLTLSASHLPSAGDHLAISVEPVGGSPTGQPTGEVILSGPVSSV